MHLMVLGASRQNTEAISVYMEIVSMHLMVLGASRRVEERKMMVITTMSQCT